jgi:hypothetical protein
MRNLKHVMILRAPYNSGNSWPDEELAASQEERHGVSWLKNTLNLVQKYALDVNCSSHYIQRHAMYV